MKNLLRRMRLLRAMRLGAAVAARGLRLTSHSRMKFAAASIIGWDDDMAKNMKAQAAKRINPTVLAMAKQWQAIGCEIVVATAAFEFYASEIVPYHVLGTQYPGSPAHLECRGEEKANRVIALANEHRSALHAVVTDSLDDMPLLLLPFTKKYYVTTSMKELGELADKGIKAIGINGRLRF